ncbi:MAG TPA: hypothetical protein VEI02_09285, partial [Planctomycetota bacterium]|nr:hypothetical protein [Planctomycetota bacterium]
MRVTARAASAAPLRLRVPADFSLAAAIASHGWYQLRPYVFDPPTRALRATWRGAGGDPIGWTFVEPERGVVVATPSRALDASARDAAARALTYALALDVDVAPLHRLCRREPRLRWIATRRLGRLLRGEDLFEDAMKILLTVNCTWKQTQGMAARLVEAAGAPDPATGDRAFPTPDAVLRGGERLLKDEVRVGYRVRAMLETAERAASGALESLRGRAAVDPAAARREIRGWYGFGPYAAASILHLLGRNDEPVVDSWAVAQAKKHGVGGRAPTARSIA